MNPFTVSLEGCDLRLTVDGDSATLYLGNRLGGVTTPPIPSRLLLVALDRALTYLEQSYPETEPPETGSRAAPRHIGKVLAEALAKVSGRRG